jgi:hypothetical protein
LFQKPVACNDTLGTLVIKGPTRASGASRPTLVLAWKAFYRLPSKLGQCRPRLERAAMLFCTEHRTPSPTFPNFWEVETDCLHPIHGPDYLTPMPGPAACLSTIPQPLILSCSMLTRTSTYTNFRVGSLLTPSIPICRHLRLCFLVRSISWHILFSVSGDCKRTSEAAENRGQPVCIFTWPTSLETYFLLTRSLRPDVGHLLPHILYYDP